MFSFLNLNQGLIIRKYYYKSPARVFLKRNLVSEKTGSSQLLWNQRKHSSCVRCLCSDNVYFFSALQINNYLKENIKNKNRWIQCLRQRTVRKGYNLGCGVQCRAQKSHAGLPGESVICPSYQVKL